MRILPLLIMMLGPLLVQAQFQKILHQTFLPGDTVQEVQIRINGDLDIQTWVGNTILMESKVLLENGNRTLFNFLEKTGRFAAEEHLQDSTLVLQSVLRDPPLVTTAMGSIREVVQVRIMIPDIFHRADSLTWKRKVDY